MVKRHFKRVITLYEVPGAIEVREMTKRVMVGKTVTCDVCGCNINKDYYRISVTEYPSEDDDLDDEGLYCTTNDAYDACSSECIKCKLDEYTEKTNNFKKSISFSIYHYVNNRDNIY